ncbi:MAG: hypothetical protein ABH817_00620 [archaeon]
MKLRDIARFFGAVDAALGIFLYFNLPGKILESTNFDFTQIPEYARDLQTVLLSNEIPLEAKSTALLGLTLLGLVYAIPAGVILDGLADIAVGDHHYLARRAHRAILPKKLKEDNDV